MAITQGSFQVTWTTDNNNSVAVTTAATEATSNAVTWDATDWSAEITMKTDLTAGATTTGKNIEFYWMASAGDPDGTGGDEYPGDTGTDESVEGDHLATFNIGGNDPSIKTVSLPFPMYKGKVYVKEDGNLVTTDAVDCSAVIRTKRGG